MPKRQKGNRFNRQHGLVAMASNLEAMASNLLAMASNLLLCSAVHLLHFILSFEPMAVVRSAWWLSVLRTPTLDRLKHIEVNQRTQCVDKRYRKEGNMWRRVRILVEEGLDCCVCLSK